VEISPNGKLLLVSNDTAYDVVELATGRNNKNLHLGSHKRYTFSTDGRYLAVAGLEKSNPPRSLVAQFDLAANKIIRDFRVDGTVSSVCISPDSTRLAVTTLDPGGIAYASHLFVFDLASGNQLFHWESGEGIASAAFSPDGNRLAVVNIAGLLAHSGVVRIFETEKWTVAMDFTTKDSIMDLEFSPDGKYVATASGTNTMWGKSGTVTLYNVAERKIVYTATAEFIKLVKFSPDGNILITGGANAPVHMLVLPGKQAPATPLLPQQ